MYIINFLVYQSCRSKKYCSVFLLSKTVKLPQKKDICLERIRSEEEKLSRMNRNVQSASVMYH